MKGKWKEQKGILNERFAFLTDKDLLFTKGKNNDMYDSIQLKLG